MPAVFARAVSALYEPPPPPKAEWLDQLAAEAPPE